MKVYDKIYEYASENYGLITSSQARELGIPNIELVKLAKRGRLERVWQGVYRVEYYTPTTLDKYAEAVAVVGKNSVIYGESVLAMHNLALVNPSTLYVATYDRIRKKLPQYIKIIKPDIPYTEIAYEGIPSQSVFEAILVCTKTIMSKRLIDAVNDSERQGLISQLEATKLVSIVVK